MPTIVKDDSELSELAEKVNDVEDGYAVEQVVWDTKNADHAPDFASPLQVSLMLMRDKRDPSRSAYLSLDYGNGIFVARRYEPNGTDGARASDDYQRLASAIQTLAFVANEVFEAAPKQTAEKDVETGETGGLEAQPEDELLPEDKSVYGSAPDNHPDHAADNSDANSEPEEVKEAQNEQAPFSFPAITSPESSPDNSSSSQPATEVPEKLEE